MAFMPDTAMVFAAGLGKRMRPVTDAIPKALIPIGGKTLVDHMLDRLAEFGVKTAIVNVHYLADQIEAHVRKRVAPKLIISDERSKLLDQGGGIKKALPHLGRKPFLVCNTDAIWIEGPQPNLAQLARAWDPSAMDVLLLVAPAALSVGVDWPGDFTMDAHGRLMRREERRVAPFVYAGVGIIKPELFAGIEHDTFRLAPFFFAASERGRLFGHRLDGVWLHVSTPQAIRDAEAAIMRSIL